MTTVKVAYAVDGPPDAPVVVMGGALGSNRTMWEPQLAALVPYFRVVRYDARGHGDSPVPPGPYEIADLVGDLVALLDELAVERAHLVGLSIGAMVALLAAATHPDRVDRMAVMCTSAQLGPPSAWAERAAAVRSGRIATVAATVVERWFTAAHRAADPSVVEWARTMIASTSPEGYAACCGAIERMDLRADLPRITAPLLAIAGRDDPSTPLPHLELIAGAVPGARLVVVDDAAHLANVDQPDTVNGLLAEHLRQGSAEVST